MFVFHVYASQLLSLVLSDCAIDLCSMTTEECLVMSACPVTSNNEITYDLLSYVTNDYRECKGGVGMPGTRHARASDAESVRESKAPRTGACDRAGRLRSRARLWRARSSLANLIAP